MTTGRSNTQPVKRHSGNLIQAAQRIWNDSEAAKERARLERLVIEAAKKWQAASRTDYASAHENLENAVGALIDYESSQQQIKK